MMAGTPAASAQARSTALSPISTALSGVPPSARMTASRGSGAGLRCGSESPPTTASISVSRPSAASTARVGLIGLLVQTPSRQPEVAQLRQRLHHRRIDGGQPDRVLAVVDAEARHQIGRRVRGADMREGALQQHRRAVADHAADQRKLDRRQLKLGEQRVDGGGDVGRAVHQRAVQIEHQSRAAQASRHNSAVFNMLIPLGFLRSEDSLDFPRGYGIFRLRRAISLAPRRPDGPPSSLRRP